MALKIYVACSLNAASDEDIKVVDVFKASLRAAGYKVLDYFGGSGRAQDYEPGQIYESDIIEGVGGCDLVIAVMKGNSDGRGFEVGAAIWKYRKPVVLLHLMDHRFSLLLKDAVEREPLIHQQPCIRSYNEVIPIIPDLYAQLLRAKSA